MQAISKIQETEVPGGQSQAAELGLVAAPVPLRTGEAAARRAALPWGDFAQAWSIAEDRLARLEQQLSSSDLRHFWICRTDFEEAAAMLALEGHSIALEDLAMADAGECPRKPDPVWDKARALLSARRHISRAGPAKVLSVEGILALKARLASVGESRLGARKDGAQRAERQRIERWLDTVGSLQETPPLAAAAIALRAWRDIGPLHANNSEMGLLLTSTLLWHWGKTKGLSARLATGLLAAGCRLHDRTPLGIWIRQFCEAVELAADDGRQTHDRLTRGQRRIAALLVRHRRNSRLPRLAWLLLSYPMLSIGFISRRLELSAPGSDWLLKELLRENVVEEATGKTRNRAYMLN